MPIQYIKQSASIWVDESKLPEEIFNDSFFSETSKILNATAKESFKKKEDALKNFKYDTQRFVYKVRMHNKSKKIKTTHIEGVFYSTFDGKIQYAENPSRRRHVSKGQKRKQG